MVKSGFEIVKLTFAAANVVLTLSNVLITLGVTLLAYHHSAGFRGNNVVLSPPSAP